MWAGSAGASRSAHASRFVGTYRLYFNGERGGKWTLDADGKLHGSHVDVWSNQKGTVTIDVHVGETDLLYVGHQTGRGSISTKRNPGTMYEDGRPRGEFS